MRNDNIIEIGSEQLRKELQEIKERLTTLESIDAYLHRDKLVQIVKEALANIDQRRQIVRACEVPLTKEELVSALNFNSSQALDHHLTPLRDHGVLELTEKDGRKAFVRSRIISKLPKAELRKLLG